MVRWRQNLCKRAFMIRIALSSAQECLWHRMSNTDFIPTFNPSLFKPSHRFIGARVLSCYLYYNLLHLPRQHIAATLQLPCPSQGRSYHIAPGNEMITAAADSQKWTPGPRGSTTGTVSSEPKPISWHCDGMYFPQNLMERLKTSSSYQRYVHAAIRNHILNLSRSVLGWKVNLFCILSNNWFFSALLV